MQKNILSLIRAALFLCFLSLLFSSCSKEIYKKLQRDIDLKAKAVLKGTVDAKKEFAGLQKIIHESSLDTTDVLMVHGVRVAKANHFEVLISTLAKQLGFTFVEKRPTKTAGTLRYDYIKKMKGSPKKVKHLRFYEVYWSPATLDKKEVIKACFDQIPNRAKLSQVIKQYSLIDVFADLTIYLGENKKQIKDPVKETMNLMMDNKNSNKVIITGSFGSQIVFDLLAEEIKTSIIEIEDLNKYRKELYEVNAKSNAKVNINAHFDKVFRQKRDLYEMQKDSLHQKNVEVDTLLGLIKVLDDQIRKFDWENESMSTSDPISSIIAQVKQKQLRFHNFIREIDCFFMLSNQLPFTGMMNLSPYVPYNDQTYNYIYQDLDTLLKEHLQIVSFYDPNDVFGYRLPEPLDSTKLEVVNVEIHNTVPFYFNPDSLRLKYLSQPGKGGAAQKLIRSILKQGVSSQSLVLDIDDPNQLAQHNPAIIKHLIEGNKIRTEQDSVLVLTKEVKKKMGPKTKVVKFNYPAISKEDGENECVAKYQNTPLRWLKNEAGKLVIKSFNRKIKKLKIENAPLPYEKPDQHTIFEGLKAALDKNDTLRILTMHGMVSKGPEHFDNMLTRLSTSLQFNPSPIRERWIKIPLEDGRQKSCYAYRDALSKCIGDCQEELESCQGPSSTCKDRFITCKKQLAALQKLPPTCDGLTKPAQIKVVEYKNNQDKIIQFFILHWSPITSPPKAIISKLDEEEKLKAQRSVLPANIKNILMNDGFVDVVLSLNEHTYRQIIDQSIKKAFSTLLLEDPFDDTSISKSCSSKKNIFFISGSLGSKLLFDYFSICLKKSTLKEEDKPSIAPHIHTQKEIQHAEIIAHRLHTFFMLSNQLPLISIRDMNQNKLKRLQRQEKEDDWGDIIYNDWGEWIKSTKHQDTLRIVAFYDPNDILGFPLQTENISDHLNVTNVPINLAAGYEIDVHKLLKLTRKLDRILFESIFRVEYGTRNKQPRKLYKSKLNKEKLAYRKRKRATQLEFDLTKCGEDLSPEELEKAEMELERTYANLLVDFQQTRSHLKSERKKAKKARSQNTMTPKEQLKDLQKKLDVSITSKLLPLLDLTKPRQVFIFDLLTAHEGGKKDERVIEMISYGTDRIQKRGE